MGKRLTGETNTVKRRASKRKRKRMQAMHLKRKRTMKVGVLLWGRSNRYFPPLQAAARG
jgi:hypothetical protein